MQTSLRSGWEMIHLQDKQAVKWDESLGKVTWFGAIESDIYLTKQQTDLKERSRHYEKVTDVGRKATAEKGTEHQRTHYIKRVF